MRSGRTLSLTLAAGIAAGCAPEVSDTGYVGTWVAGSERGRSTIAIHEDGGVYRFRWKMDTADGKWRVRCDWDGRCMEEVDGEKVAEYHFVTRQDPATGHLLVECTGKVAKPRPAEIHYMDELVVDEGGRTLISYSLLRGGQRFTGIARPKRSFEKVSNEVGDPPGKAGG